MGPPAPWLVRLCYMIASLSRSRIWPTLKPELHYFDLLCGFVVHLLYKKIQIHNRSKYGLYSALLHDRQRYFVQ